jgi:hypothetical protein
MTRNPIGINNSTDFLFFVWFGFMTMDSIFRPV